MSGTILIIGLVASAVFVMLPGWGVKHLLARAGLAWQSDSTSSLLAIFALGVHVNALLYIFCWAFVSSAHPVRIAAATGLVSIAIGLTGFACRKPRAPAKPVSVALPIFIVAGVLIGAYAAWHFPSVLDSVQIFQTQQWMLGLEGGWAQVPGTLSRLHHLLLGGMTIPSQPGFAGITLAPALLQPGLPVTTTAAGMKPLLLGLAAVVSLYTARQFRFKPAAVAACLILANLVFSHLGLYGLLATGKDSVFAILMAMASIASMQTDDPDANEPGLFMSAAVLLGAVVAPFLMLFWLVYFIASLGTTKKQVLRQAVWCFYPLTVVTVGVHMIFARPGSPMIGVLPLLIAEIVALTLAWRFIRSRSGDHGKPPALWTLCMSCVPAICIVGVALMLPATAHVISGYKDGLPVITTPSPLDGLTTARQYFYQICPVNNAWLATIAALASAVLPWTSARYRTPFYIALFTFIPLAAFVALGHLHLGLHILPDFNIWDITRDSVQWYVGAFAALFSLLAVRELTKFLPGRIQTIALPLACAVAFAVGLSINYPNFMWLIDQPLTTTRAGGFNDKPTALAMDYLWQNGKGQPVYVTPGSALDKNFPVYEMFSGTLSDHLGDVASTRRNDKVIYLTDGKDARRVAEFGRASSASIDVLGLGEEAYAVTLNFDGKGSSNYQNVPKVSSSINNGAYDVEAWNDKSFRWVGQTARVSLSSFDSRETRLCANLEFINPNADPDLAVTMVSGNEHQAVPIATDATFAKPATTRFCPTLHDGYATIELTSNAPGKHFPNDSRSIAFGLMWPLQTEATPQ